MANITAKVPITEIGSAKDGMMVAERLRKKTKITITTRQAASRSVNCTSSTEARMDCERS